MKEKILYFEGAGWSGADISRATVGNCRIRTAFHLDDGRPLYLEMSGRKRTKHDRKDPKSWKYIGFVSFCYYITDDHPNDDCNEHRVRWAESTRFEYTEEGILRLVNSLGASFTGIKVLPDLGGYRVSPADGPYKGTENYYYADEFRCDPEMIARREAVYDKINAWTKAERMKKYGRLYAPGGCCPWIDMWVDEFDPGLLRMVLHQKNGQSFWEIRTDIGSTIEEWMATVKETL